MLPIKYPCNLSLSTFLSTASPLPPPPPPSSSSPSSSVCFLRHLFIHPTQPPPLPRPPLPPLRTMTSALLPYLATAPRFSTASFSSTPSRLGECGGVQGLLTIPEVEGEGDKVQEEVVEPLVWYDTDA